MKKARAPERAIGKSWEVLRRFDELVQSSSTAAGKETVCGHSGSTH